MFPVTNFKDSFRNMPAEDVKAWVLSEWEVSRDWVEKMIVESRGYTHNTDTNGPDGFNDMDHNDTLEAKSQGFCGAKLFSGSIKYSAISKEIYDEKLAKNEPIDIVGFVPKSGKVFYYFRISFDAIADKYISSVHKSKTKNWNNADMSYLDYVDHPSFEIVYIADRQDILDNIEKFSGKFGGWLLTQKDNLMFQNGSFNL